MSVEKRGERKNRYRVGVLDTEYNGKRYGAITEELLMGLLRTITDAAILTSGKIVATNGTSDEHGVQAERRLSA